MLLIINKNWKVRVFWDVLALLMSLLSSHDASSLHGSFLFNPSYSLPLCIFCKLCRGIILKVSAAMIKYQIEKRRCIETEWQEKWLIFTFSLIFLILSLLLFENNDSIENLIPLGVSITLKLLTFVIF